MGCFQSNLTLYGLVLTKPDSHYLCWLLMLVQFVHTLWLHSGGHRKIWKSGRGYSTGRRECALVEIRLSDLPKTGGEIQVADWSYWGNVLCPMPIQVAKLIVFYIFVKISTVNSKIMNPIFYFEIYIKHCIVIQISILVWKWKKAPQFCEFKK